MQVQRRRRLSLLEGVQAHVFGNSLQHLRSIQVEVGNRRHPTDTRYYLVGIQIAITSRQVDNIRSKCVQKPFRPLELFRIDQRFPWVTDDFREAYLAASKGVSDAELAVFEANSLLRQARSRWIADSAPIALNEIIDDAANLLGIS